MKLTELTELKQKLHDDRVLDILFDAWNDVLWQGNFETLDAVLLGLVESKYDRTLFLITYLTLSACVKTKLSNRAKLYDYCKGFMTERQLMGLE